MANRMKQITARLAKPHFHEWLIPEKSVMAMLSIGLILVFAAAILLAISSVSTSAYAIIGSILLVLGLIFVVICICLCAHACCVWYVRDEGTQTFETAVISGDQMDGEWYPSSAISIDKRAPNGVLRDGRQSNTLNKKHVTISPKSNDSFASSGYMSPGGRPSDSLRSTEYSKGMRSPASMKSDPGSPSDMSTLASFAYLNDPNLATPYSSFNQRRQLQGGAVQIPVQVQDGGYGSMSRSAAVGRTAQVRPYQGEQGHAYRSNAFPTRRHSDDDYDNAGDVSSLLSHQSYQPASWQPQPPPMPVWQQQQHQQQQQNVYNQPWPANQPQPQQTVWQYQTPANQSNWRQVNTTFEEPPPMQPLVHPSQKRPMTFDQISSSKVSLYDNIQMNRRADEE